MKVRIHWRRRHVTDERLAALRAVLAAHPGDDEVLIRVTGTGELVRLPIRVDASVRNLRHEIHVATGACATIAGPEPTW